MGGVSTTPKVLTYLSTLAPGAIFDLGQVVEGTGLERQQAQAAIYLIMKRETWPLEVLQRGHTWRNTATAPEESDPDAFAGTVVDRAGGHLIIRDDEGYLYLVKRIGLAED
jgi:hypothetical protein